ncbi:PP2C family protein-serine/threonine phosphatase [Streptomyces sp. NPDC004647]|uniref:PP2C family protein-serine/threonine phosphatase n=1 Tax=Streptomyces sp. NPDC004647 TaxID=3154671 RepID=UPI0033B35DA3
MALQRPRPSASDDELLDTLGKLTGQVVAQSKLRQARVELAVALQHSLLPVELPDLPGLRTAARYAPAQDGLDIGGDWYDVFWMPDNSLAFAIGDVQGHGVESAAVMGQIRATLRALALSTTDPGEILGMANELLVSMGTDLFVTCCLLRFHPSRLELASARAGHVPAIWCTADGLAAIVLDEGGLPLGIQTGERYPVTRHLLMHEGAFVLFTDGVVEGPSFPIESGLERAAEVVGAGFHSDPDLLAAEMIELAALTGHADDAAVLVLRHAGAGGAL